MRGTKSGAGWILGRGGWWCVAFALGVTAASTTSCLEANRGHCLYEGGDLACAGGMEGMEVLCLFAPAGGDASGVGDDGCFVKAPDEEIPNGFFHAQYGLPKDQAAAEDLLLQLAEGRDVDVACLEDAYAGVAAIHASFTRGGGCAVERELELVLNGTSCEDDDGLEPTPDEVSICTFYERLEECLGELPPDTDTDTSTATDTVDDTATTADTTATSGETTEPECTMSSECTDEARPVCDAEACVPCNTVEMPDEACAEKSAERPFCNDEGRCVPCRAGAATVCTAQGLLCDEESGECVSCTEHAQCEVGACAKAEGTCFPADAVVLHVDEDGGQDHTSVGVAVNAVADGGVAVIVVHAIDDGSPYTGAPRIDGGKTIALLAAAGEQPTLQGVNNPGLRVEGAGTVVYMEGLRISQSSGLGLQVTGATAWVDRSEIVDNDDGGILAQSDLEGNGAVVWVDRSRIVQNAGGGIRAENGATLTLRNSFVGGDVSDINALVVTGSTADILYTTVGAGFGTATALTCDIAATVTVRNSLFVARTDDGEIDCEAMIDHSAAELELGDTNEGLGNMSTSWFIGYGTGNFALSGTHPALIDTAAQWQLGDPATDIDGNARPTTPGADYAGADVP